MDYESRLSETYSRLLAADDVVVDVGAHIGRHSREFAKLVGENGRVYCFEALPETYVRLATELLQKSNVTLMNMALAEDRGVRQFVQAIGHPEESGLRERHLYNSPSTTTLVPVNVWCDTLDHVCGELVTPRYIKIDVEGAELDVLRGGEHLIRRTRPVISVEWGAPTYKGYDLTPLDLWTWVHDRSYVIFDINLRKIIEYDDWNHVCEVDQTIWDFWLVPSEYEAEFLERVTR